MSAAPSIVNTNPLMEEQLPVDDWGTQALIELDTPTIAREMPMKLDAGAGEASQARHKLVAQMKRSLHEPWSRL
jgi:hypothetical protein